MTMFIIFICCCHAGITVLAANNGMVQTAYLEQVDHVIINSSLLNYSEPCRDVTKAGLILLLNKGMADKRSVLYDDEEKRCYVFSYSLLSAGLIHTEADLHTGLIYIENKCFDGLGMNCACHTKITHLQDCHAYWEGGYREPGVYTIQLDDLDTDSSLDVWCDFDDEHGWTVIQRRIDGTVDFFMYWADYKRGFGDLKGEYWLGNDNIHALTANKGNKLLKIYMQFEETGEEFEVTYEDFEIDNEENLYRLLSANRTASNMDDGCSDDAFAYHVGQPFSARDRENDSRDDRNCAVFFEGGWWYNDCLRFHPNGSYRVWRCLPLRISLQKVAMKVTRGPLISFFQKGR